MPLRTGSRDARAYLLLIVALTLPAASLFIEPIPQDPGYHLFADRRTILGIPNFWNVVSNLPFVIVGAAGLLVVRSSRVALAHELRFLYPALFAAVIVTGFGSAAYHVAPTNASLVWDRLGITLSIAALFCIVLGEYVSSRLARRLFIPLVALGIGTVAWWAWTESRLAGDLRPYALFQFMPMLLIPMILLLYPSGYDRSAYLWWVIALYALAKVCELLDGAILATTGLVGGHSLKHLVAALAMAVYLYGLSARHPSGLTGQTSASP